MSRSRPAVEALEGRALLSVAGSPALTFGSGGLVVVPSVTKPPQAVAVGADGKIVAFTGPLGSSDVTGAPLQSLLLRFNPNGSLDTSFGVGGEVAVNVGTQATIAGLPVQEAFAGLLVQPDGKIIVAENL